MKSSEPEFITIGRILATWGIKGKLKVEVVTDFPQRFTPGTKIYIESLKRQIVINDTGGDVQKYQIDVYTGLETEPVDFGSHQSKVWRLIRE